MKECLVGIGTDRREGEVQVEAAELRLHFLGILFQ
jgi:hypothetical protein